MAANTRSRDPRNLMFTTTTSLSGHHPAAQGVQAAPQRARRSLIPECGIRRVPATHSVYAAAGVRSCAGQIQLGHRRPRPAESRRGTKEQLLVDLRGTTVDRPTDQVGVSRFEIGGTLHGPAQNRVPESGRVRLELGIDPFGRTSADSSSVTPRGRCVYAHAFSVPAGDRVGSVVVICPKSRNETPEPSLSTDPSTSGPSRSNRHRHARCPSGQRLRPPRHRTVERVVHLDHRRVPFESLQVGTGTLGDGGTCEQLFVQRGRRHVREYRPPGLHPASARSTHRYGGSVFDVDIGDAIATSDLHTGMFTAADQSVGEGARTADRTRETHVLGEHGQDVTHHAATRGVGRDIGVHGIAEQEQAGCFSVEQFLAEATDGKRQHPGKAQRFRRPECAQQ